MEFSKENIMAGAYKAYCVFDSDLPEEKYIVSFINRCKNLDYSKFSTSSDIITSIEWFIKKQGHFPDMMVHSKAMELVAKAFPDIYQKIAPKQQILEANCEESAKSQTNIPKGVDPDRIVDLKVEGDTAVSMDGTIPKLGPMSISLDDDDEKHDTSSKIRTPGAQIPSGPVIAMGPPIPVHKVDVPPVKKPEVAQPDPTVEADCSKIHVPVAPPKVVKAPEFIQKTLAKPKPQEQAIINNKFDNSALIKKYPKAKLDDIEHIANANGCIIGFVEWPDSGIISCYVSDTNDATKYIPWKCFSIDTGMMIDPRVKLIALNGDPCINPSCGYLERAPMYELFNGVKGGKALDTRLLETVFQTGVQVITKKRMYVPEFQELNLKVALITLPTDSINRDQRREVQSYLMQMDKDGYFDRARQYSPNARFVFATRKLNPSDLTEFTLINEGVPIFYGGPVPTGTVPLIINSTNGKISIMVARKGQSDPPDNAIPIYQGGVNQ